MATEETDTVAAAVAAAWATVVLAVAVMEATAALAMVALATVEAVKAVVAMVASATVGVVMAMAMGMEETPAATVVAWKAGKGSGAHAVAATAEGLMVVGKRAGSMVVAKEIEMVAERVAPQALEELATEMVVMLEVEGMDRARSTLQQTQSSCR